MTMVNLSSITRGSIWFVDLNPTVGHEHAKRRPCLVISANGYNQNGAGLVVVLPITSRKRDLFWQVPLQPVETGLEKESYVICDQIRSVSLLRFSACPVGRVSDYTMAAVEKRSSVLLALIV
jgi:mRNA interferase MazF